MRKTIFIFILLILSGIFSDITGQESGVRPKIGLALSGGGSLGMAHVGVLKVMEEAGLRPDYITGVSMGSIVGAMYSIGYRADTLGYLFRSADWDLILSNNVPENKVIFTEKKYFNNSIISMAVSSKKVTLPSGLINGQQIEKQLSYFAWPAADISDFSKLPIPFLCIGTDLISTKKVVFKTGYLPDAIRASMAVPTIFTPIKIDTAVLIDGGFVRNFAVSELREMGADIIIGSYTGFHRYDEKELESVTGVFKQVGMFNAFNDYQQQKKLTNILIEPHVRDLSSGVFTNADTIINRGYVAAQPFREQFRKLADSLNRIGPQKPPENILHKQFYEIDKIEITGNEVLTDEQILGVLDIEPGQQVTRDLLSEKIDLLYGRSWFTKVKYRIDPASDSLKLVIECTEKPRTILYGSVHYDNFLRAGILLNLSSKNLIGTGSHLDIDTYLAQFYRFRINYTKFIDRIQKTGLSLYFNAVNSMIPVMRIRTETGQYASRSFQSGLSFNRRSGLNHFMSISGYYENLSYIPDFISPSQLKKVSYHSINGIYSNQFNTLDTKHFPNKGVILHFSAGVSQLLSGKINKESFKKTYTRDFPDEFLFGRSYSASAEFRQYFSPGGKTTLSAGADIVYTYTTDSLLSPHSYYFAGGTDAHLQRSVPLAGFHSGEIQVEKLAALRFDGDWEFQPNLHLSFLTSFAVAEEPVHRNDYSFLGGYGFGLGYMSIIGPMKVGFMHGFSSNKRYLNGLKGYITIGFSL